MKICKLESHSTKSVTIICIDTTFSSIVFIAYQTIPNKISHGHCFWISGHHNMLQNISQSSPDIRNLPLVVLYAFGFFLYVFSPIGSSYKHTSVQYATVSVIFCQGTIIKCCPGPDLTYARP